MTSLNDENKNQLFTPVDLELLLCSSGFTMHKPKTPVIALGLLTLFFGREIFSSFFLCLECTFLVLSE